MLSDAEKENIRLEETYRAEIRKSLAPKQRSGVWTFLNSSFGLWLLSAIFITVGGALWKQAEVTHQKAAKEQQAKIDEAIARRQAIGRLDLEIGYRFSQVQQRLYHLSKDSLADDERQRRVQSVVQSFQKPPGGEYSSLYPDFANFSLVALVSELQRYARTSPGSMEIQEPDAQELNQVLADLSGPDVFFEVRKAPYTDPTKVAAAIIDRTGTLNPLVLERWKTGNWYFLDGSADAPFP